MEIDAPPGRAEGEFLRIVGAAVLALLLRPHGVDVRPDGEAVACGLDGGPDCVGPRHGAELAQRFLVSAQAPGHGDRLIADIVDLALEQEPEPIACLALDEVRPHVRRHRCGTPRMEIEMQMNAALRHINLHDAEAGDPRHLRIHHALHEGAGDRGIYGVATALQRQRAGFDGLRLRCHDHSAHALCSLRLGAAEDGSTRRALGGLC